MAASTLRRLLVAAVALLGMVSCAGCGGSDDRIGDSYQSAIPDGWHGCDADGNQDKMSDGSFIAMSPAKKCSLISITTPVIYGGSLDSGYSEESCLGTDKATSTEPVHLPVEVQTHLFKLSNQENGSGVKNTATQGGTVGTEIVVCFQILNNNPGLSDQWFNFALFVPGAQSSTAQYESTFWAIIEHSAPS